MAEALRYKDKVTIVTGGSKGIGRGCVEVFVQHGSKVVFCARGEKEGKELEEEMNKKGPGSALFVKCDMTSEQEIKRLIDITVETYGQIDCVINNAGVHPPHMTIDEISADDFRKLLDVNLVSYFMVAKPSKQLTERHDRTRDKAAREIGSFRKLHLEQIQRAGQDSQLYALPHLRKTKGNLIQDSSLVAEIGQPGAPAYVATKGGITSLTKALAIDEAANGVRVNTFAPGNVWTPMWDTLAKKSGRFEEVRQAGEDAQLLGRYGTAEECGKACLFLAADATFCTGINIFMSGGAELNYGAKNPLAQKSYKPS